MQININTDAMVVLTHRLEQLSRSALPMAVRGTLNAAAFDVKGRTLERSATRNFIRRSPTFFRAFSGVNKANGYRIEHMNAQVGMTANGRVTARTAVANLEKQEVGGIIRNGADYLKGSRISGSNNKRVRKSDYFNKANLIKGNFKRSGTASSNYVAAAFVSLREKKAMSINTSKGRFLMMVTGIRKGKKGVKIRSKLLIMDRGNHGAGIKATHFSKEAAIETLKRVPDFYQKEALRQFAKVLKM